MTPLSTLSRTKTIALSVAVLMVVSCVLLAPMFLKNNNTEINQFEKIVIQHGGRLKALDTYARANLLLFYERSSIKGRSASQWLLDTLLKPEEAYEEFIFRVRNREVLSALGVPAREGHLYSFNELSNPMRGMRATLHTLHSKKREDRTSVENQLVELYLKTLTFLEISRSLSALVPDIVVEDKVLAKDLGLTAGTPTNYFHFVRTSAIIQQKILALNHAEKKGLSESDRALIELVKKLNNKLTEQSSPILTIIPPLGGPEENKWLSPSELMDGRQLNIRQTTLLGLLSKSLTALYVDDSSAAHHLERYNQVVSNNRTISTEVFYNKADLFYKSLYCYLGSFLLLMISWLFYKSVFKSVLRKGSFLVLSLGALFHTAGMLLRMMITGRPPVSNLYESIIFVGLITVIGCILLENRRRNSVGIFSAATLGSILHFIGFSYAADGDTMGMLVAVLDSNFWLATHVVTITIGYGTALVAGILGHIYLFLQNIKKEDKNNLRELYRNMVAWALVALFFTTLGTILGGIWADQSWGRFWGWDPKENGALLITLWLLALVHGRISGIIKGTGFAVGLVVTNVVVALAWFGVNLLNVGLHNYGFTENIAINLAVFCSVELLLAITGWLTAPGTLRRKKIQR